MITRTSSIRGMRPNTSIRPHLDYGDICVCVCACVCVCVCVCVCLSPSTVKASSVWNSWDCQGTDQRCCVEDVGFLCRFPSFLLWNAEHTLSASRFILFAH